MAFLGKWTAISYNNMKGVMLATGIPDHMLNPFLGSVLVVEFNKKGNSYYKTDSVEIALSENEFKSGEPFTCKNWLDQSQNWIITVDDDKVIEKRKVGDTTVTFTYEVQDDMLIARCQQVGMAQCMIKFKKA